MPAHATGVTKEDLKGFKEEIVQQFHVSTEGIRDEVKQVAEGVAAVDEKIERTRQELKEEIDNKTQPIAQAVGALNGKANALDRKVASLDNKVTTLQGQVTALDVKVDRIHLELKAEIQETRQEILAAVKFSYAELDKRLTNLEQEFLDLKARVAKIESRSTV
jgi:predicted  nucleic acid-binding Zn-ribbon protein